MGSQTEFLGKVSGSGSIRVDGRLQGEVDVEGDAYIGQDGVVVADIRARDVVIAGEVRGNVHSAGRLELLPTSRLFGDIHAVRLAIADGAMFRGNCQAYTDDPPAEDREGGRRVPARVEAVPQAPARESKPASTRGGGRMEPALPFARSTAQADASPALDVRATPVAVGGATATAAMRDAAMGTATH